MDTPRWSICLASFPSTSTPAVSPGSIWESRKRLGRSTRYSETMRLRLARPDFFILAFGISGILTEGRNPKGPDSNPRSRAARGGRRKEALHDRGDPSRARLLLLGGARDDRPEGSQGLLHRALRVDLHRWTDGSGARGHLHATAAPRRRRRGPLPDDARATHPGRPAVLALLRDGEERGRVGPQDEGPRRKDLRRALRRHGLRPHGDPDGSVGGDAGRLAARHAFGRGPVRRGRCAVLARARDARRPEGESVLPRPLRLGDARTKRRRDGVHRDPAQREVDG